MSINPDESNDAKKSAVSRATPYFVGAFALAGVAFAALVVSKSVLPEPAVKSDPVAGLASIDAGLMTAEASEMVVPVTFNDGEIDILYAGAPECSHCQAFMEDGFGKLVAHAEANNLDLAYMPMAMSAMGVAIAAVEKCALPVASISAPDVVRTAYRSVEGIQEAARSAAQAAKDGEDAQAANGILEAGLADLHASISGSTEFDGACYQETIGEVPGRMGSFSETFGLTATPSFYVSLPDGTVLRSVGRPDYSAMENLTK